jgi:alkylation response protein AidB-like acyl-CoA dehydrogenase
MSYFDLNLDLTPEDNAIREAAHKFAKEVMRPLSIELDRLPADEVVADNSPFWGFLKQAYELGYHKAGFPVEVGGLGFSPIQCHILLEELCWGSGGLTSPLLLGGWPYVKILQSMNMELIEEFVIPFCQCTDASITGTWAVTEPDHGSDTLNVGADSWSDPKIKLQLRAGRDGDEWVLNGQKSSWVSCGPTATHVLVSLQVDTTKGPAGGGACIVPMNLPGITRGKPLEKLGIRELPQGQLFFDNVRIPERWMFVGPEEYGDWVISNLGFGNTGVSVFALGLARAAFEETLAYAKERVQGGKPLIDHDSIKIRIHRMFAKVEAIRAMSRAVWNVNTRAYPPLTEYACAAKTFCTETAREVIDEGVQIHGANGVTKEYYIEKLWRDARPSTIADGENSILNRLGGHILQETFPRTSVNLIA